MGTDVVLFEPRVDPDFDAEVRRRAAEAAAKRKAAEEAAKEAAEKTAKRAAAAAQLMGDAPEAGTAQASPKGWAGRAASKVAEVVGDAYRGVTGGTVGKVVGGAARGLGGLQVAGGVTEAVREGGVNANALDNITAGAATIVNPMLGLATQGLQVARDKFAVRPMVKAFTGVDLDQQDAELEQKRESIRQMGFDPDTGQRRANKQSPQQATPQGNASASTAPDQPQGRQTPQRFDPRASMGGPQTVALSDESTQAGSTARDRAMKQLTQGYVPGGAVFADAQMADALGRGLVSEAEAEQAIRLRKKPTLNQYLEGDENAPASGYRVGQGQGFIAVNGRPGTTFGGLEMEGGTPFEGGYVAGKRRTGNFKRIEENASAAQSETDRRTAVAKFLMGTASEDDLAKTDPMNLLTAANIRKVQSDARLTESKADTQNTLANLYAQTDAIQRQLEQIKFLPPQQQAQYAQQKAALENQLRSLSSHTTRLETGKPVTGREASPFEIREVGGGVGDDGITPNAKRLVQVNKQTGQAQEITPTLSAASAFEEARRMQAKLASVTDDDDPDGSYRAHLKGQIAQLKGVAGGKGAGDVPPMPGAARGKDGNWYVRQGGGYAMVQ